MSHTTLGLNDVLPPKRAVPASQAPCPKCGAAANKRMKDGGFGPGPNPTICGVCAYEFPADGVTNG